MTIATHLQQTYFQSSRYSVHRLLWTSGIKDVETGESEVQGFWELHNEFEANLGYMRPCLTEPEKIHLAI